MLICETGPRAKTTICAPCGFYELFFTLSRVNACTTHLKQMTYLLGKLNVLRIEDRPLAGQAPESAKL